MDHQNLSEHVLCMVLYLIELGLENSADDDSEEEVSTVSSLRAAAWAGFSGTHSVVQAGLTLKDPPLPAS